MRLRLAVFAGFLALVAAPMAAFGGLDRQGPLPVHVGGNVKPPEKIKDARPRYPADAQRAGAQGVVILEITIDASGEVTNAVVKRSIPLLDAAAIEAVRQWEYRPTITDGKAVPIVATVTVNFTMQTRPGDVEEANAQLLRAAQVQGGGTLTSFGPNMSLAKELLERGERDSVVHYLEPCRSFWKNPRLDEWIRAVQDGHMPDFGAQPDLLTPPRGAHADC